MLSLSSGSTLIRLLRVIANIAILAGTLLPTREKTKSQAHGIQCLGSAGQVMLG